MRFAFSTDRLAPRDRFEGFRELADKLFDLDLENRTTGPYRGEVDLDVGGPTVFGRVYGSSAELFRTPQRARQLEQSVWLLLTRSGRMRVRQGDIEAELAPGQGIIFDAVAAHAGQCVGDSDTFVVRVPGSLLRTLRPANAPVSTTLLPEAAGITRLIRTVLETYSRLPAQSEAVSFSTGRYLADLVALALGTSPEGTQLTSNRGLRAARLEAVLQEIGRSFLDPGLGAADVAQRLGITPRYVHMLLEETGKSFSQHLLERRLDIARSLLADPRHAARKIAEIAYACGFADLSYFNRRYRQRFGITPSDTRGDSRI